MSAFQTQIVNATGTAITTTYAASDVFFPSDTDFQAFEVAFARHAASTATGVTVEAQVSISGAAGDAHDSTNWIPVTTAVLSVNGNAVQLEHTLSVSAGITGRMAIGGTNLSGWPLARLLYKSVAANGHASDVVTATVMARGTL